MTALDAALLDAAATRYLAGETCDELAPDFGVSPMTVYRHLCRMGVPIRRRGKRTPQRFPVPPWRCPDCSRTLAEGAEYHLLSSGRYLPMCEDCYRGKAL